MEAVFILALAVLAVATSPPLFLSQTADPGMPDPAPTQPPPQLPPPEVYSLHIVSRVAYRYAHTSVTSRLANPANKSQEVLFSVVLPETAFISGFVMEIDGRPYEAYVRERQVAKHEYEQAVSSGQAAAHVAVSARDSNRFTVSVNVEPQTKVTFNLTYEELLTRRLGDYRHVVNLHPGQLVRDLVVDVFVEEARNITRLHVPVLRSGNEIDPAEEDKENPLAVVQRTAPGKAHVRFAPSVEQQQALGGLKGLGGQLVVEYDVERDPQAGEVLLENGYFVHFFAPTELPPLKKHAIFVLDVSGSMEGRKIAQLKEAMAAILDDLQPGDYFNIVEFSYSVTVWNLDSTSASAVFSPSNAYSGYDDVPKAHSGPTPAFPATPEYIKKAKEIVGKMRAGGGTNIHDALKTALQVAKEGLPAMEGARPEPLVIFLTDGEPTVGEVRLRKILVAVSENNQAPRAAVFSLAFGDDADLPFLRRLSLANDGFARKIYEAADAALQLRDFYRQVASPLLANVTFNYRNGSVDEDSITRKSFHALFAGGELVVAGRVTGGAAGDVGAAVSGWALDGPTEFPTIIPTPRVRRPPAPLERLWAYLTIRQLLDEHDAGRADDTRPYHEESDEGVTDTPDASKAKSRALELALKYAFVTPLTSLVVVKPNQTDSVNTDVIQPASSSGGSSYALPLYAQAAPAYLSSMDRVDLSAGPALAQEAPSPLPQWGSPSADDLEPDYSIITLDELPWLPDVTNGSDILLLPVGVNGTEESFLLGLNETESGPVACTSSTGVTGVCRHLPRCVLGTFRNDLRRYLTFFCSIGRYAGVCCPDGVSPADSTTTIEPAETTTEPSS